MSMKKIRIGKDPKYALKVSNLTCKFFENENFEIVAIDDFSFNFERNKIYFIIGNSGSGKSTLVSHFNGLIKSKKGELQIEDFWIKAKKKKIPQAKRLKTLIGMVFQFPEYQLFKASVEKDISFGPIVLTIPKQKALAFNLADLKKILFQDYLIEIKTKFGIETKQDYFHFDDFLTHNRIVAKFKIKNKKNLAKVSLKKGLIRWKNTIYYSTITPKEYASQMSSKYLNKMGLDDTFLAKNPLELSGGQKRRVAIAGILAIEPQILIFDEPTAGLDPQGEKEMLDLILQAKNNKQTIIVITHVMDQVLEIGDYVLVLDHGKIMFHGKPYEVFCNEKLYTKTKMQKPKVIEFIDELSQNNPKFKVLHELQPKNPKELAQGIAQVLKGGKR